MNAPTPVNIVVDLVASCQPNPVSLSGGPVMLSFQLSADAQAAGWVFDPTPDPSGQNEDQYSGITVYSDSGSEFTGLQTASNANGVVQVTFTDLDDNSKSYAYSVKLRNAATSLSVTIDPSIRNQTLNPGTGT